LSDKYESRSFTKEWLEEEGIPYDNEGVEMEDELGGGRWMDYRTITFEAPDDGFWYQLTFEIGKTENQECHWDEYLDFPVECFRVEQVEVMVKQWKLIKK
jgi:hypothetical protein